MQVIANDIHYSARRMELALTGLSQDHVEMVVT